MKLMQVVLIVCVLYVVTGCSSEPQTDYAQVNAYRVVNMSYGTEEGAKLHVERLLAVTDAGDTLSTADFDTLVVFTVGIDVSRGELQYPATRGANGKYSVGTLHLVLGNTYRMRYQERGI